MSNLSISFSKHSVIAALLFSLSIYISSCSKSTPAATTQYGNLYLQFKSTIGHNAIDSIGKLYADTAGRRIALNIGQFYICGITLHSADGATYIIPTYYGLNTLKGGAINLGQVPVGTYAYISFSIGVDAAANSGAPTSYPANSVLAPQTPPMWFGNTAQGFMFVNVQGFADTTSNGSGTLGSNAVVPISYQLGTNALLRTVTLPYQAFTLANNQNLVINLTCDYGKLLAGVNFKTNPQATPFTPNANVMTTIANNVPGFVHF